MKLLAIVTALLASMPSPSAAKGKKSESGSQISRMAALWTLDNVP